MYGRVVRPGSTVDQQRFAYPITSLFLFAPIAAMSFAQAQAVTLLFFLVISCATVGLWLPQRMSPLNKLAGGLFVLASFPVILGLQLRQPTILVAVLLSAAVACMRANRLVSAGILLALATAKPQLALPVMIPMVLWAGSAFRLRKHFLVSLVVSECVLLGASELLVPGWIEPWLHTLKAYTHYAGARPLASFVLGTRFPITTFLLGIGITVVVAWKWRSRDLLLPIAFCIAVCQLIFPFSVLQRNYASACRLRG